MKETKDEKNISAVKPTAQTHARFPLKNADTGRESGHQQTPRERKTQINSVNIRTTGDTIEKTTVAKPSFSFPREYRLRLKSEFKLVYSRGKRARGKFISIVYFTNNGSAFKAAVVVRKKHYKRAVDRNKIKRRLREIIRLNKNLLPSNLWIIIHAEQGILKNKFCDIKSEFLNLCKKSGLL